MRLSSALCLLGMLGGCGFGKGDAHVPGEPLGSYHVAATLDDSSCGPGALGSPEVWEFDVKLSRDGPSLYWLNGEEAIAGTLSSDGVSFAFDVKGTIAVEKPAPGRPGCNVVRTDVASGKLGAQGTSVPGFSGKLVYGYAPVGGSDCTNVVGVDGGFATLPCEIGYGMEAVRTGD